MGKYLEVIRWVAPRDTDNVSWRRWSDEVVTDYREFEAIDYEEAKNKSEQIRDATNTSYYTERTVLGVWEVVRRV